MRIKTKNIYLTRLLAKLFQANGYRMEFVFRQEQYDDDITELAFLKQNLEKFEEGVILFREKINEAIVEVSNG